MAKYKSIVITNAGLELIAATHSGGTIEFTGIKTGNGTYDGTEVLADITDLKSVQQTFGITGLTRESAVIKVRSSLTNNDLAAGYYITEIGLFAMDPSTSTEILYAVVVAESGMEDYLPAYADSPQNITLEMYIAITDSDNVSFTAAIIPGTYVTVEDFNSFSTEVDSRISSISTKVNTASDNLASHTSNTNNPHSVTKEQLGLGNVNNTSDAAKPISTATQAALDTKAKASDLENHTDDKSNPHNVTKTQLGLENVNNTADTDKPVSTAQQSAIDLAYHNSNLYTDNKIAELINGAPGTLDTLKEIADAMADNESVVEALEEAVGSKANEAEFTSHVNNTSNPHSVTKAQVGLGNVPNVATNDQTPTYTASTSNANLTSGEKLSVAFGKIAKAISSLISHLANKSNPHSVTKEQVGLGYCDNTSDADKPISTATQTALNVLKASQIRVYQFTVLKSTAKYITNAGGILPRCIFACTPVGPSGVYFGSTFISYPYVQIQSNGYISASKADTNKTFLNLSVSDAIGSVIVTLITDEELIISDSVT